MTVSIDALVTPGDMARLLHEPEHRVKYLLNTRPHIQPLRRAGIIRLYAPEAVDQVRQEIAAIDSKRRDRVTA